MTVAPCTMPRCGGPRGDPELTALGICDPCRRRYRRLLDDLVLDWATLHHTLPAPAAARGPRVRTGRPEYGHPRQWASDLARAIADALDWTSDALRDHLHLTPPPPPVHDEGRRVAHAWRTLTTSLDALCTFPGAAAAAWELDDLHGQARRGLGLTRARTALPVPCPACGTVPVFREVHPDGADDVTCDACGTRTSDTGYAWWTRVLVSETAGP